MSYRETEIKLPIREASEGRALLEARGARVEKERHFEDNLVLDTQGQDLRKIGKLLRLRRTTGKEGIITFKGKSKISDGVKDREEWECSISNADLFLRILDELGFGMSFRYQKYRTVYRIDSVDIEFCIDETPIGTFLELEGDIDQIHIQAERLGFQRSQYITDSYAGLYFKWCQDHNLTPSHMTFP